MRTKNLPKKSLTSSSVDSSRAECLPHNCLTDIGGNKEGDTRAKTISFLQQLIQQQHNDSRHKQLHQNMNENVSVLILLLQF